MPNLIGGRRPAINPENYRAGWFYRRRLSGILAAMMSMRVPHLSKVVSIAIVTILSACTVGQPIVVEKLDELTAVTITYGRTPIFMSPDTPFDREAERDYVQIGAIEVNRMGTRQYYLWLGISDMSQAASAGRQPEGFDSIFLIVQDEEVRLDILGWTPEVIGASEPVYEKLFATSADAYYQVTLDQIQLLTDSGGLKLRTTDSTPIEFVPWYKQTTFEGDLSEFVRTVSQ